MDKPPATRSPRELPKHPVISWGAASRRLQVSKSYLWDVMHGKRTSPPLRTAYEVLVRELTQK